jgi:hypothetical protein
MTFPSCNPIDYGWFNKSVPIDHVGTIRRDCKVCEESTVHEEFLVVIGSAIGFGAPFFAKPFMKRTSTAGKIGGIRGRMAQCTSCNSLWPTDQAGKDALAKAGFSSDGLVGLEFMADYRNRQAETKKTEARVQPDRSRPVPPSKRTDEESPRVRKTIEPD